MNLPSIYEIDWIIFNHHYILPRYDKLGAFAAVELILFYIDLDFQLFL